ncbi:metallophosphoesterase family protein [Haloarchaeobius litoreus]|uniref:Metallophosphoesterase family protein n=1 Tax=Haloarchaeobius litoreus TaxID=755306 RepID=A0ABD6DKA6_9EURY|nr:metallophosphoesterase family protein [Haloarchaeobius litoreus]
MRFGVISDVHANAVALRAVLDDMPPVDGLLCAGDVVGYGPAPGECVDELAGRDVASVSGNHDRAVVTDTAFRFNDMARAGVEYAREQLTDAQLSWLADLPTERREHDGYVKLVHGHPDDPDHYTRPHEFSPDLLRGEAVLVMGHTHVQHHERYDEGVVMNPGSVGQPRDSDPRAAYAVLDMDAGEVDERRVEYDIERVQEQVREAGLPERIGTRLEDGR